jgi:hypothetical protein
VGTVEVHMLNAMLLNGKRDMIERIDRFSIRLCRLLSADGTVVAIWMLLP